MVEEKVEEVEKAPVKTIPSSPKNLSVGDVSTKEVTLSWQAPDSDGGAPLKVRLLIATVVLLSRYWLLYVLLYKPSYSQTCSSSHFHSATTLY